eukprot:1078927-Pelagomonas_calceolata.AAC.4
MGIVMWGSQWEKLKLGAQLLMFGLVPFLGVSHLYGCPEFDGGLLSGPAPWEHTAQASCLLT